MSGKIYVAKETFVVEIDGSNFLVTAGKTRVREGHALLKGRGDSFQNIEDAPVDYDVEKATAAPGEKRGQPEPEIVTGGLKEDAKDHEPAKKTAASPQKK